MLDEHLWMHSTMLFYCFKIRKQRKIELYPEKTLRSTS